LTEFTKELLEDALQSSLTINAIRADVSVLKADVCHIKEEQQRQGLVQDSIQSDIKRILDVVSHPAKKTEDIDPIKAILDTHETRISVSESVLKQHIANKKIHTEH
jgi:hypothetical protein